MPISDQTAEVGVNADGQTLDVVIGPEGMSFTIFDLTGVYNGSRTPEMFLFQLADRLQQAGVNPNTASPAEVAEALDASNYRWGN